MVGLSAVGQTQPGVAAMGCRGLEQRARKFGCRRSRQLQSYPTLRHLRDAGSWRSAD